MQYCDTFVWARAALRDMKTTGLFLLREVRERFRDPDRVPTLVSGRAAITLLESAIYYIGLRYEVFC